MHAKIYLFIYSFVYFYVINIKIVLIFKNSREEKTHNDFSPVCMRGASVSIARGCGYCEYTHPTLYTRRNENRCRTIDFDFQSTAEWN